MSYFYHGVPEPMIGTILMPLNQMKTSHPELFNQHVAKYEGREEILERRIEQLDCLWNDVIQMLPMDPQQVFQLQKDMALISEVPPYRFFKIDVALLDPDKVIVYFKTAPGEENSEVKWLRDVDLDSLLQIPEATINYYKTLIGTGELPFNYQFIPHIAYKGTLDISQTPVITLHP